MDIFQNSIAEIIWRYNSTVPECVFRNPLYWKDVSVLRALLAVRGVLAVTIVLVNVYTIAAIWPRRRRRSTQSSLFVLHLALADVLCGFSKLVIVAFSMDCTLAELAATREIACLAPVIGTIFTWTLSATTLAAIAVDRYVCIVHSLRYYEFMNTRRVLMILGSIWVFSVVSGLLYLPTWDWKEGSFCQEQSTIPLWHLLAVQLPVSVLVLCVVAVTHLTIRHEAEQNMARCRAAGNTAPWFQKTTASVQYAKITILVVLSFVMCYLPMEMYMLTLFLNKGTTWGHWDFIIIEIFSSLWYLLNPFIYAWKNTSIREDMTVLWRRLVGLVWRPRGPSLHGKDEDTSKLSSSTSRF